jgi:saccharopine dehydrogenase-like NADP-dependent oxidoreductase
MQERAIHRVAVLGLGNIGTLVAELLVADGFEVTAADARPESVAYADAVALDVTDRSAVSALLGSVDAVLSCLPYQLNADIAQIAHAAGIHYLDLTEDVGSSRVVRGLAEDATSAFIPHCGLAPGFICVVGGAMATRLDVVDRLALRVGALPRTPNSALGYAFNWSPAGVVNEYLNACEILHDYQATTVPPLAELEPVIVDGIAYEAFTTSGGLGTMCDTFGGQVRRLDYKTIRYPGHCDLMRFFLQELHMGGERGQAEHILSHSYPPVRDDVVVLYAAAEGRRDDRPAREEFVRVYRPRVVAGRQRTAIAWTTAAGAVGALELLAAGTLPQRGLIRQEQIPLEAFLATPAGSLLDGAAVEPVEAQPGLAVATAR